MYRTWIHTGLDYIQDNDTYRTWTDQPTDRVRQTDANRDIDMVRDIHNKDTFTYKIINNL